MVVGVVTLSITFMQDEVAVCHTVHAHVHDRLITHANRHAAVACPGPMALDRLLARLATLLAITHLCPHVVLFIVIGLAARAFRALMGKAFLRALDLCLLVWLHRLLL